MNSSPAPATHDSHAEFVADPFARTYRVAIFFTLIGLLLFTRLWDIGTKTMMHDELLFVNYSYNEMFRNWNYEYQPILHGPIMLWWQTLVFHLFGASDYTARLGVALLGIASFFWVWSLRPFLREAGTWFALGFYVLAPGITFFQRFFHQDAMFLFCSLWIISSFAHWWRTGDGRWGASAIIACTALFCNKASAVFIYFSVLTFFALMVVHDLSAWLLEGKAGHLLGRLERIPRFPSAVWPTLLLAGFVTLVTTMVFEGIIYDADVRAAIGHDWILRDVRSIPMALGWMELTPQQAAEAETAGSPGFWRLYYVLLFGGFFAFFTLVRIAVNYHLGYREFLPGLWKRIVDGRYYLLGAIAGSCALYLAIFTMMFKHETGFFEIYSKTWSYWGGQHEWGRIAGPFHQHLVNLVLYESPSVLVVVLAWFFGVLTFKPSRATGVCFLLMILAVGAFHGTVFSKMMTLDATSGMLVPIGVNYLKSIFVAGAAIGVLLVLFPGSARAVVPLALLALIGYSLLYFTSDFWARAQDALLYKDGMAIRMMGRHMTLKDYMEAQLNMDAGWNLGLVLVLIFFATFHAWDLLSKGRRFHAFAVWWMVTGLGAACYAREAVPQVGIHPMIATIVCAACYFDQFWRWLQSSQRVAPMGRMAVYLGVGVLAMWNVKNTFMCNFYFSDDPRERMAYGPINDDIRHHMNMVRNYYNIASLKSIDGTRLQYTADYNDVGKFKDVRIFIKTMDHVTWPALWYLRSISYTTGASPETAIKEGWDFIFLDQADVSKYPELKEKYNIARGRSTSFWTPSPIARDSLQNIWKEMIPGHYLDGSPQAGEAFNAKADWKRVWRYLLHRETFDGTNRPFPSVSTFEYTFCWRKDMY